MYNLDISSASSEAREEWRSRAEGIIDIAIHEEVWERAVYLKTLIEHPSSSRLTDAVARGHIHQRPELFIHCLSTLFAEGPGAAALLHLLPCSLWAELIIPCFSVLWGGEKQPFWMDDNESLIKSKRGVCARLCVCVVGLMALQKDTRSCTLYSVYCVCVVLHVDPTVWGPNVKDSNCVH